MNNFSGLELVTLVAVVLIVLGLAPYITWRRGGSKSRIIIALLVSPIPYVGWVAAMIIALTTRRPSPSSGSPVPSHDTAVSPGAVSPRGRSARTLGIIGVVVGLVLASIASGAIGYYLAGQDNRATPPTWVDREIRATGTQNVGTLRCTYHLADGSVRVRESVIAISTNPPYDPFGTPNPFGARTPDCPPSP